VLLLAAQALVERAFERAWPRRAFEQQLYIPSGRHLKAFSLGFPDVAADALWMRAIGYYGGHALTDREYPWLHNILDQITNLDPAFRFPYLFGGIVLAIEGKTGEQSIALLRKGMSQYPGDWRFPFYIGFGCFYHLQDPERAAAYMRYAASLPGSPEYLPRLAASLTVESGRVEAAIRFLTTLAEGARDEAARASILQKIEDLRAGRTPESLRAFLSGRRPR
jgi:tetratricopeptide (TPR) repeat protein